jgi:hypothetical protein
MDEGHGKSGLLNGLFLFQGLLWPSMKTIHQELKKL